MTQLFDFQSSSSPFKQAVLNRAQAWYREDLIQFNPKVLETIRLNIPDAPRYAYRKIMSVKDLVIFSVLLNSINYQFWDMQDGVFSRYSVNGIEGANGMHTAFEEAFHDPGSPLAEAIRNRTPLSQKDIISIFNNIPDAQNRAHILSEITQHIERLDSFIAIFESATSPNSPVVFNTDMAAELAQLFPRGYADPLLKKAQLAISELACCIQYLFNPSLQTDLTIFADYQIPNVLRHLNVLTYSAQLADIVDHRRLIPSNSSVEKAIRASAILAVEHWSKYSGQPSAVIDYNLFIQRKDSPYYFHLTKTSDY